MLVPISVISTILVSEVACEEYCARFWQIWPIFGVVFLQILPQLKTLFPKI